MNDKDFHKAMQFKTVGGGLLPINDAAISFVSDTEGQASTMSEVKARDINFHRAYFSLLSFIHSWLPQNLKELIDKDNFYIWLKHAQGKYNVKYEFKDKTTMVEYESISFGRMSQTTFKNYVREQLTWIYAELIHALYAEDEALKIIESIEFEFESYLNTL